MKLKKDIIEALATPGLTSTTDSGERSGMLLRDLDELSGLPLGARERFLVTRIETVLCERERNEHEED